MQFTTASPSNSVPLPNKKRLTVGQPFSVGAGNDRRLENSYQKKKSAKSLPMQNASGKTSKTQVGQTSNSSIPENNEKVNRIYEKTSDRQFALDIDSGEQKKTAKDKAQARSERTLENKKARLEADYTTDKVFSQASVTEKPYVVISPKVCIQLRFSDRSPDHR